MRLVLIIIVLFMSFKGIAQRNAIDSAFGAAITYPAGFLPDGLDTIYYPNSKQKHLLIFYKKEGKTIEKRKGGKDTCIYNYPLKIFIYRENGLKESEYEIDKENYITGFEMSFDSLGVLKSFSYHVRDKAMYLSLHPSGRLESLSYYTDPFQVGYSLGMRANGQIGGELFRDSLYSTYNLYYNNGQIYEGGRIALGVSKVGKWSGYYSDGTLQWTGEYYNIPEDEVKKGRRHLQENYTGLFGDMKGVRNGTWKYYNEKGKLVRVENYKMDGLISAENFK